MSLTVQSIIDASSTDVRKVINNTGSDATLMIGWVDRIHKDALHTSLFNNVIQKVVVQAVSAGLGNYTLTATDIRRVLAVYDRTFNRALLPIDVIASPLGLAEQSSPSSGAPPEGPKALLDVKTMGLFPEYYKFIGTQTLYIFPAPATSVFGGSYEVHYESQINTVVNLTDVLLIPEDGKDLMVAGVNALAFSYLKSQEDFALWQGIYERAKRGELIV